MSTYTGDGQFTANTDAIGATGSTLQVTSKNLDLIMETLARDLQPIVETWSGDAQQAYYTQMYRVSSAMTDIIAMLHRLGVSLGQAAETFWATEKKNAASWANVSVSGPR